MYQQTPDNRKESLTNHSKQPSLYITLRNTHELIVKRLEERKDNKNEIEDIETFKS